MKSPAEAQRLLDDVLGGNAEEGVALLDRTLAEVRRRRQVRRHRRTAVGLAALALAVLVGIGRPRPSRPVPVSLRSEPASELSVVRSTPIPATMLVRTSPGSVGEFRSFETVMVIRTESVTRPVPLLNDNELFALLAGRPAMLVRPSYGPAELLLLNPAERVGYDFGQP